MSIDHPTELDHCAITLIGKEDACDLNAAAGTEKKISPAVPTGKVLLIDHVVMDEFSAACTAAVVTFGKYGGSCDEFVGDRTLTNISGTGGYLIIGPVPDATPLECEIFTAGEFFAMEITTAEGSALTARVKVFGHYDDA